VTGTSAGGARGGLGHIELWYLAYALFGVSVAGGLPILLPLTVIRGGTAGQIGLVIASMNLGSIAAPLWGELADRWRVHRALLAGGMAVTASAVGAFAFASHIGTWVLLALLLGLGSSAASTVAYMFVVEVYPKDEWSVRIGGLQTVYGLGWISGLVLAGATGRTDLRAGLLICGALTAAGAVLGWPATRTPPRLSTGRPVVDAPVPVMHVEHGPGSLSRNFHALRLETLRSLGKTLATPFGRFLGTWLLADAGGPAYYAVYPVLMQHVFQVGPARASLSYAAAVVISLFLYAPAGRLTNRLGATRVLQLGFAVRLLALVILAALAYAPVPGRSAWAELWFAVVVTSWALIGVSGVAVAAQRAPMGEGEAIGIFTATTALAGAAGAAIGGAAADRWGYGAVPVVGAACIITGLLISAADPGPRGSAPASAMDGLRGDGSGHPPGGRIVG